MFTKKMCMTKGLCMCMCATCVQGPAEVRKSIRSLRATVAGGCELSIRVPESNPDLLKDQQVLLTAEPSLQFPGVNELYCDIPCMNTS